MKLIPTLTLTLTLTPKVLEGNLRKLGGEIAARGEAAGFVIIEEGVDLPALTLALALPRLAPNPNPNPNPNPSPSPASP